MYSKTIPPFFFHRRQTNFQASDVFVTNIRNSGVSRVDFDMYVQKSGTNEVLNQQALLTAVMVKY